MAAICPPFVLSALGLMAVAAGYAMAAESPHAQLQVGAWFVYSQDFERPGNPVASNRVGFHAKYKNNGGGIIFAFEDPHAEKPSGPVLENVAYTLSPNACVVDVLGGDGLLIGDACQKALPKGAFSFVDRSKVLVSCSNGLQEEESVEVPAGKFKTVKIECERSWGSPQLHQRITYWYAPMLDAMVKVIRKTVDASGAPAFSSTEQLLESQSLK